MTSSSATGIEALRQRPRASLGYLPTPLEPLKNITQVIPGASAEVLVKRDDLTGFSFAGNKLRLLEFLIGDALDRGTEVMVGCGPTTSNFIASLSQASRASGMDCEIYIPAPLIDYPSVLLARATGAKVTEVPVTRFEIDGYVAERAREIEAGGRKATALPRGGCTAIGAVGYALGAAEITAQLGDRTHVTHVLPAGSCASASGILAGLALLDSPHKVIAVSTNRPIDEAHEVITSISNGVVALAGRPDLDPLTRLTLLDRAEGSTEEDLANARRGLAFAGIATPDHYGPPTVSTLVRTAQEQDGGTVVWWHTGGALGVDRLLGDLAETA